MESLFLFLFKLKKKTATLTLTLKAIGTYFNAKIKVAVPVENSVLQLEFIWKKIFPYEGKQMIDPRIYYANEPGFRACILPYFKANFFATFHQPRFVDGSKRNTLYYAKYSLECSIILCSLEAQSVSSISFNLPSAHGLCNRSVTQERPGLGLQEENLK